MFDGLIKQIADRLALGANATHLQDALLGLVFEVRKGGVPSLLAEFRRRGRGPLFESWIDNPRPPPMAPHLLGEILGARNVAYRVEKSGIERPRALEAAASMLPALIGHLTAGGSMPTSLPARACAERKAERNALRPTAAAEPARVDDATHFAPGLGWLKWALLTAIALAMAYCVASPLLRVVPTSPASHGAP